MFYTAKASRYRELNVHKSDDVQPLRESARDALDFGDCLLRERDRRRNRRGVARVAARRLDVLENRADDCRLSVRHAVDVELDGVGEELVDEDRTPLRYLHRLLDVFPEALLVVDDRHAASSEDERRTHEDGIADLLRDPDRVAHRVRDAARRLLHADFVHKRAEEVAVLRERDVVRRSAEDVYARSLEFFREVERGLSAELHNRAVAFLALVDLHHVLERERLEVELVRSVVVGRDCLWIGVHHNDLDAHLAQRKRGVAAAPVELDALSDAVRPPAQDHDLLFDRIYRIHKIRRIRWMW